MASWVASMQQRARQLKQEVVALYLAFRDPRTPWYAKAWIAVTVAYALSPIDLIPDMIPVLGYLDDLLLVPLGIWVALKLIPDEVLRDSRAAAADRLRLSGSWSLAGTLIIVALWLLALGLIGLFVYRLVWPAPVV